MIVKKWLKTEIPINSNRNTELIKEITKLKWELKNWMDLVSDCDDNTHGISSKYLYRNEWGFSIYTCLRFSKKRVWKWRFMPSIQGNEICRGIENYGEDG